MADDISMDLLVEGMLVLIFDFESEMTGVWRPVKLTSMAAHLESVGKTWSDLDEQKVRANLGLVWVARKGVLELPALMAEHDVLSVEPVQQHDLIDYRLWDVSL